MEAVAGAVGADLHVHTAASDGLLTPPQVVERAAALGLAAIAVADHDTTAGVVPARVRGAEMGLQVVPAVEINTEVDRCEVHILGYWMSHLDRLESALGRLRRARQGRARTILHRLAGLGISLDWERVLELAQGGVLGRLHIARAMVEQGYAQSVMDAFENYLLPGRPAYVPRYRLTPAEAIALVRQAGGAAVLAHPATGPSDAFIRELVACGLQGLEVYHPSHGPEHVVHYLRLAGEHDLVVTGGSDFHGPGEREGSDIGSYTVGLDAVVKLEMKARAGLDGTSQAYPSMAGDIYTGRERRKGVRDDLR